MPARITRLPLQFEVGEAELRGDEPTHERALFLDTRRLRQHYRASGSYCVGAHRVNEISRYDAATMTPGNRQAHLEAKIDTLKQELLTLGDLRPGTLSEQYNVCGKAGCACKADPPRKHGPYYQVSFTWQGRSHTQFVRRENLAATRQQLRTYERLRALVDAWVAAGLELAALRFGTAPVRPRVRPTAPRRAAKRAKSQ